MTYTKRTNQPALSAWQKMTRWLSRAADAMTTDYDPAEVQRRRILVLEQKLSQLEISSREGVGRSTDQVKN